MTTPSDPHADLLNFAKGYQHKVAQPLLLEPHKEAVLLLRAKNASFEAIVDALATCSVRVSITTVRKFCRRYHSEITRMRAMEAGVYHPKVNASSPVAPSESNPLPSPSLVKRGPRVARDDL